MVQSLYGMPVKGNGEDGDSMLWAGLMTTVGDLAPIRGIKMCQSADGRLWRSPLRVDKDTKNSFSRDMALGFILYFQRTQDHEMANKWIAYIKKNGFMFPAAESTDNRHIMTPSIWWLMSYAGMNVPAIWKLTRWLYRPYLYLETMLSAPGYQTHLKGVATLILSIHDGKLKTKLGEILWKREPNNAFFAYLAGHKYVAQSINNKLRAFSRANRLDYGHQWCWERTDSEEAYRESMGWDFEFIDRLLALPL